MMHPSRVGGLAEFIPNIHFKDTLHKISFTGQLLTNEKSAEKIYECWINSQYSKLHIESLYTKVFQAVYEHFLSATDHLEYHLMLSSTTAHNHHFKCVMFYIPIDNMKTYQSAFYRRLGISHRQMCFSCMPWMLVWPVHFNAHDIRQIKTNIQILHKPNELLKTLELAHFLNLIMVQVSEHQKLLYGLVP